MRRRPPPDRVGLGRLGVGQVLGVRPGHVPGSHRGAGRHLHRGHEAIVAGPVAHWTTRHGPGTVEAMPGDERGRTLWRHRNFLLLWGGQTISEMGSAVTQLALPLTAVVVLHASTFQVSWLAGWWVFFSPLRTMRDVPEEGPEVGTEEGLEVDRAPGSGIPG